MRHFTKTLYIILALLIASCDTKTIVTNPVSTTLSGTAATGIAIDHALVTVVDQAGLIATTETDENGKFTVSVADLKTAPFLLKVDLPNGSSLFSIAEKTGVANIHPLSDQIARLAYQEQGTDLQIAFDDPTNSSIPDKDRVKRINDLILSALSAPLKDAGIDSATFDPVTTPFNANGTGFDGLLDLLVVAKDGDQTVLSVEDVKKEEVTEITIDVKTASSKPGYKATDKEATVKKTTKSVPIFSRSVKKADPASGTTVSKDQLIAYTIDYVNSGTVGATGVTIIDQVDKRMTDLVVTSGGTVSGNTLSWAIGSVAAGGKGSVGFSAKVAEISRAAIVNHAIIQSKENTIGTKTTVTFHKMPIAGSTLRVEKIGKGTGSVKSNPAGIDCGTDCSELFTQKGQKVTLTATSINGSAFSAWSGGCSGKATTTSATVTQSITCMASFDLVGTTAKQTLIVEKIGTGAGKVVSLPAGISCGDTCKSAFPMNAKVTLTAEANAGAVFMKWSGDCSGSASTTSLTMSKSLACRATFDIRPPAPPVPPPTVPPPPPPAVACTDGGKFLETINVKPATDSPVPTVAGGILLNKQGPTVYIYEHTTDGWLDSPGFAGRKRKFAVTVPPGYDPAKQYPLMIWLHGGCGDYTDHLEDLPEALTAIILHPGDPNTAYENEHANCTIPGKIPHYGYMNNFTHSTNEETGLEQTEGEITTSAMFVDYTQRRYRYYIDFTLKQFAAVDPNRVFVRGHSKGGAGTIYTTLFNQDKIAGGISDVLRPNIMPVALSVPNVCNNYGVNMFNDSDMAGWIQNHPNQLNFWIQTDHGKDDRAALFSWFTSPSPASQNLSFFDTLEQYRIGHYTLWDEGGHSKNSGSLFTSTTKDPILGYHWWDGGWSVIDDPISYLRLDKSFPAFSQFSYNQNYGKGPSQSDCALKVDPVYNTRICAGTITVAGDNRHDGAIAGVLNRHLRWNTNTIVDTAETYSIDIMILDDPTLTPLGGSCGSKSGPAGIVYPACYEDYIGKGIETVSVTPRRLQKFKVSPGAVIQWKSSAGQAGSVTADPYGVITVPAFEVATGWRTLTLFVSSTPPPTLPPAPPPPEVPPVPPAPPAPPPAPTAVSGLYGMGVINSPTNQAFLDNPDLAGVSLRFSWDFLQPTEGPLNTELLLAEIKKAKDAGKKIQLRVLPGMSTPEWVYGKGVSSVRFATRSVTGVPSNERGRIPVPWDPNYLTVWKSFIAAAGEAVAGTGAEIVLVHVTGANSKSGEFHLISGAIPSDLTSEYLDGQGVVKATGRIEELLIKQAGYSLDNIKLTWATSLDAWANAFPKSRLSYDIVDGLLATDGIVDEVNQIVEDGVVRYPNRLTIQNNAFSDTASIDRKLGSNAYQIIQEYADRVVTGFQTGMPYGSCPVGSTSNTGDLGPALAVGIYLYGADYFELYVTDIGRYLPVVTECNDFLLGKGSSCGTAGPLTCLVDVVKPTLSFTAPTDGATVSGEIAVTVATTDNVLVFKVTLLVDGGTVSEKIITPLAGPAFKFLLNTQTLTKGEHLLTATAEDVSGNKATTTRKIIVE